MVWISDKGNSVVNVDKDLYVKSIDPSLNDKTKFKYFDIKKDSLSFTVNHKKHINKYWKSLKWSGIGSIEKHQKIKERLQVYNLVFYMVFFKHIKRQEVDVMMWKWSW